MLAIFEKLINEHGSSSILKEKIQFINEIDQSAGHPPILRSKVLILLRSIRESPILRFITIQKDNWYITKYGYY